MIVVENLAINLGNKRFVTHKNSEEPKENLGEAINGFLQGVMSSLEGLGRGGSCPTCVSLRDAQASTANFVPVPPADYEPYPNEITVEDAQAIINHLTKSGAKEIDPQSALDVVREARKARRQVEQLDKAAEEQLKANAGIGTAQ